MNYLKKKPDKPNWLDQDFKKYKPTPKKVFKNWTKKKK